MARRADIHQAGEGDSVSSWFQSVPMMTKFFMLGTFACGAMVSFGAVNAGTLYFSWPHIRYHFEIWRLFTPFLFAGAFSFPFVMHLWMLYQNCSRYEANPYNTGGGGSSADMLWMILLSMMVFIVVGYIFDFHDFSDSILYTMMYVWSRREPNAVLSMWGFKVQSMYLPWVYLLLRMLMGGSILMPLVGVAVGHVYFFAVEVMPLTHGISWVRTPDFCIHM
jgi:Derlin-2/3